VGLSGTDGLGLLQEACFDELIDGRRFGKIACACLGGFGLCGDG
jgi:hypothetical protein